MDLTAAIGKAAHAAAVNAIREAESGGDLDEADAGAIIPADFAAEIMETSPQASIVAGGIAPASPGAPIISQLPVFQLTAFPLTVDPKAYVKPVTNSNPGGSYTSLFALRALVDPIPSFTRFYTAADGSSIESAWDDFIGGAAVLGNSIFARNSLLRAQRLFEQSKITNLDGSMGSWRPVYATPEDWYDFSIPGRFVDFEIDLSNPDSGMSGFATIPGSSMAPSLNWLIAKPGNVPTQIGLDSKTRLKKLRAKALVVTLAWHWLDQTLLKMSGLYLPGQPVGLYSSGELDGNAGVMPLIPSAFCLAVGVSIEGDWSPTDSNILVSAAQNKLQVALGHFALSSGIAGADAGAAPTFSAQFDGDVVTTSAVQLIGWISSLVPLCPRIDGNG